MKPSDREAVLYAFAIEANHDRETIERYLRQYPELAEDLTDILSERRLREASCAQSHEPIADPDWEEDWKEFLQAKPQAANSREAANPFARFRGQAFTTLADTLNVPRSILTALRDGLVEAASIPERFIQRLANATESSVDSARSYLGKPQLSLSSRAFKSDKKPSHQGQITFEALVRRTDMTAEQRQVLLEDCKDHGLNRGKPSES